MNKSVAGLVVLLGVAGFVALGSGLAAADRLQTTQSTVTKTPIKNFQGSSLGDQVRELAASFEAAQHRISELENQLADQEVFLAGIQEHITIDGNGNLDIEALQIDLTAWCDVNISGANFNVSSSQTNVDSAISDFSGVVSSEVVETKSVISSSYTPGTGNLL